jgi:transcriptional regulator with XRE-family HTH domain
MVPTNQELGDAIGVSSSMASRIRNGHRLPGVNTLTLISKYLNVDLAHLHAAYSQGSRVFGAEVRRYLEETKR